jgi:exonuclease SbcD
LTDEEEEPDAAMKLRNIYPNMIRLRYDNKRTQSGFPIESASNPDKKSPIELFGKFFELQYGQPMSQTQEDYARELFTKIWEAKA